MDNNHTKVIQLLATQVRVSPNGIVVSLKAHFDVNIAYRCHALQGAELKLDCAAGRLCSAAFADNLFELQHLVENGIDANSADYDKRTGKN